MLKCISHPGLEDFSQDRLDVEDVDSGGVEMRPGAGGVAGSAGQRKASATADLLSSTRAYLSCVLASSALDGSITAANNAAIDNKIEQAMDLVKSHLMFAVREEVEILKEQIKCLMAKNNRLEFENAILREHASAETLAKLKEPLNQSQVIENP